MSDGLFIGIVFGAVVPTTIAVYTALVRNSRTKMRTAGIRFGGRDWLAGATLLALAALAYLPFLLMRRPGADAAAAERLLTLLILSAQLLLVGVHLYVSWRTRIHDRLQSGPAPAERQYDDGTPVSFGKSDGPVKRPEIKVRSLICDRLGSGDRLELTWATFGNGIEFLIDQINSHAPKLYPDLVVGVNSVGMAIGTSILGALVGPRGRFGYVRTEDPEHKITEECLPDLPRADPNRRRIALVVDHEVKSGSAIASVARRLHERYDPPESGETDELKVKVLFAAFVACDLEKTPIHDMHDLIAHGVFAQEREGFLPDFLAFSPTHRTWAPERMR